MTDLRTTLEKTMCKAYQLQWTESTQQCPRGLTSAIILDSLMRPIGTGRNLIPANSPPCNCDCGANTLIRGSATCRAVHAEVAALRYVESTGSGGREAYLVTTRAPCKKCMTVIMESGISVIATTDQYPDRDESQAAWHGVWYTIPVEDISRWLAREL